MDSVSINFCNFSKVQKKSFAIYPKFASIMVVSMPHSGKKLAVKKFKEL